MPAVGDPKPPAGDPRSSEDLSWNESALHPSDQQAWKFEGVISCRRLGQIPAGIRRAGRDALPCPSEAPLDSTHLPFGTRAILDGWVRVSGRGWRGGNASADRLYFAGSPDRPTSPPISNALLAHSVSAARPGNPDKWYETTRARAVATDANGFLDPGADVSLAAIESIIAGVGPPKRGGAN
jgi:hypothetical protein